MCSLKVSQTCGHSSGSKRQWENVGREEMRVEEPHVDLCTFPRLLHSFLTSQELHLLPSQDCHLSRDINMALYLTNRNLHSRTFSTVYANHVEFCNSQGVMARVEALVVLNLLSSHFLPGRELYAQYHMASSGI